MMQSVSLRSIWCNPMHFIACGFGTGAMPVAPGTFGSLAGVVLVYILAPLPFWAYLTITVLLIGLGVYLCDMMNRALGTQDHPAVVWDELATYPLVMLALPKAPVYMLLGFVLFRVFDIAKPGPIGWIDKNVHGGIGVMLDDVLAALCAAGVLWVCHLTFL